MPTNHEPPPVDLDEGERLLAEIDLHDIDSDSGTIAFGNWRRWRVYEAKD